MHPFREEFLARIVRGSAVNTLPVRAPLHLCQWEFLARGVIYIYIYIRHTGDPIPFQ